MSVFEQIDGATPIDDISGLIPRDTVKTRDQLNEAEALNIAEPFVKYIARGKPDKGLAPFDLPWLFTLHHEMFGKVWTWAGERRQENLNLGSPHYRIDQDVFDLTQDLAYWDQRGTMPLAEQAVRLHHRAVVIHPFMNGNGRWSRLVSNIWLYQHGGNVTNWPEQAIGNVSVVRGEYLDAVRAADRGDYEPLLAMQSRYELPAPGDADG